MSSVVVTANTLPPALKMMYGAGGIADSIKSVASGLYLLFFYTSVLGLPARLVGVAAAVSLVWDASIDPLIGRWSDRTRGRLGRRHGWMIAGGIGMGIAFVGLFVPPAGLPTSMLFAWLLLMSLLLRAAHSAFAVPYLALGAELHSDYDERTRVASWRAAGAQVGAIVASSLPLAVFFRSASGTGSRLDPASYSAMALTLGAVIVTAALAASFGTRRYQAPTAKSARGGTIPWRELRRNRPFLMLTGSASLAFLATVMSVVLSVYFLTLYVGLESGATLALCQLSLHGGAIAGVLVWARCATYFDKHHLFIASAVLTGSLMMTGFALGASLDLFAGMLVPVVLTGYGLTGAVSAGMIVLPASMLADVAAEHELRTGVRCEGAFFGAFSSGHQIAAGLATVSGGLLVDHFAGIVPGSATQSSLTVSRIGILGAFLPGALVATAAAIMIPYRVTRQHARQVEGALAARTATGAENGTTPSAPAARN
jgi:glycoside/pentoside/hexuronide:cation symporter, GPH family